MANRLTHIQSPDTCKRKGDLNIVKTLSNQTHDASRDVTWQCKTCTSRNVLRKQLLQRARCSHTWTPARSRYRCWRPAARRQLFAISVDRRPQVVRKMSLGRSYFACWKMYFATSIQRGKVVQNCGQWTVYTNDSVRKLVGSTCYAICTNPSQRRKKVALFHPL